MLRITRVDGPESLQVFKLEGRLLEPWVAEVLRVCDPGGGQSVRTSLDLFGLVFVDQAGTQLLKELIRRGVTVSACSGFVAELLQLRNP
jgi:hypothetical protein